MLGGERPGDWEQGGAPRSGRAAGEGALTSLNAGEGVAAYGSGSLSLGVRVAATVSRRSAWALPRAVARSPLARRCESGEFCPEVGTGGPADLGLSSDRQGLGRLLCHQKEGVGRRKERRTGPRLAADASRTDRPICLGEKEGCPPGSPVVVTTRWGPVAESGRPAKRGRLEPLAPPLRDVGRGGPSSLRTVGIRSLHSWGARRWRGIGTTISCTRVPG